MVIFFKFEPNLLLTYAMKNILALIFIACTAFAFSQVSITGTVTTKGGSPVAGATIIEKGTSNGTFTDDDGKFRLTVQESNATLVVRYVGMKTIEHSLNGATSVNLQMKNQFLSKPRAYLGVGLPFNLDAVGFEGYAGIRMPFLYNSLGTKLHVEARYQMFQSSNWGGASIGLSRSLSAFDIRMFAGYSVQEFDFDLGQLHLYPQINYRFNIGWVFPMEIGVGYRVLLDTPEMNHMNVRLAYRF